MSTNIDPGSHVVTDGWKGYEGIDPNNYKHQQIIASRISDKDSVLAGVLLVANLVKRLILGTFQGRFAPKRFQSYMDIYVFRFNRRTSRNVGKKFMRIAQQVVVSSQITVKKS